MNYDRLTKYYMSSDEYRSWLDLFLDPRPHALGAVVSELYLRNFRREAMDGGELRLHLTESEFLRYFSDIYSEAQRFCAIYARWMELPPEAVRCISNLRNRGKCLALLGYFLCSPSAASAPDAEALNEYPYSRNYYLLQNRPNASPLVAAIREITPQGEVIFGEPNISLDDFKDFSRSYEDLLALL